MVHGLLTTPYGATKVSESKAIQRTDGGIKTSLTQSVSHSFWRNASIMSAYGIEGCFGGSLVTIAKMSATDSPVWCLDVTR